MKKTILKKKPTVNNLERMTRRRGRPPKNRTIETIGDAILKSEEVAKIKVDKPQKVKQETEKHVNSLYEDIQEVLRKHKNDKASMDYEQKYNELKKENKNLQEKLNKIKNTLF